MNNKIKIISSLVVVLASATVYLSTMPDTIFLGDNAEFITAGSTLGVPHPPGFPVFILLAKLFSFLPLATIVWKINLLSVVSAIGSLILLNLVFIRILQKFELGEEIIPWLSVPSSLILAFSGIFWEQAIMAEAYALNVFFVIAILYLYLLFWERKDPKIFMFLGLAVGLGCANHPMIALFVPFFIVAMFLDGSVRPRHCLGAGFAFFFGLSFYFFLPIFSGLNPALDWGDTNAGVKNFINHIIRAQYNDLGVGASFGDKMQYLVSGFYRFVGEFGILLAFVPFGLFALYRKTRKFLFLSLGIAAANVLGIILLRNVPFSFDGAYFYASYYGPAYAVTAIWVGIGVVFLARWIFQRLNLRPIFFTAVIALLILSAGSLVLTNYNSNNLSEFNFMEDFSREILQSLEQNAVLIISAEGIHEDTLIFSLLYQRVIQGIRPDIHIVGYHNIFSGQRTEDISKIYLKKDLTQIRQAFVEYAEQQWGLDSRPVYTTFLFDAEIAGKRVVTNSNGYVYRLSSPNSVSQASPVVIDARDEQVLLSDYAGRDFLAYYYLVQAAAFAQAGDRDNSQALFIKAIENDNDLQGLDLQAYRTHRDRVLLNKSL